MADKSEVFDNAIEKKQQERLKLEKGIIDAATLERAINSSVEA